MLYSQHGSRQRAFWTLSPGDLPGASALILPRWPQEAGQPQSHWGLAGLKIKTVRKPGGWPIAAFPQPPRQPPCLDLSRSHELLLPQVRKSIFGLLDFTSDDMVIDVFAQQHLGHNSWVPESRKPGFIEWRPMDPDGITICKCHS